MKELMIKLDDALFDYVFQPILNRIKTIQPQEMATLCLALFLGFIILKALYLYAMGLLINRAMETAGELTLCLLLYGSSYRAVTPKTGRNPLRISSFHLFLRIGGVVFLLYNLLRLLIESPSFISSLQPIADVIWTVYLYFEACDRPPPPAKTYSKPVLKVV